MPEVVYQAFQINICYNNTDWHECTKKRNHAEIKYIHSGYKDPIIEAARDCKFKQIGTDETGIPIVVTRVAGTESDEVPGGMTGLQELYIEELITSVEFLANVVSLECLELVAGKDRPDYYQGVNLPLDIAPLGNLKNLKYLAIRGFELENAHVIDGLPNLEVFNTDLYDHTR